MLLFFAGKKSDDPLSPDYVPSIFEHIASPVKRKRQSDYTKFQKRQDLKSRRREQNLRTDAATALLELGCNDESSPDIPLEEILPNQINLESDITEESIGDGSSSVIENLVDYEMECKVLRQETCDLQKQVESLSLTEQAFKNDNGKVKFYTGLPNYEVFDAVLFLISPQLKTEKATKLSTFQQVLLTLMKLRLNLPHQDLAYRFGVHMSTISRTLHQVINLLHAVLVPLALIWPEREVHKETLPMSFRSRFRKCIVIIDCFEVALEKASDHEARSQTYSSYKSRNTLKYLIGIAPQGVITFISKGWGGRVSDKHLTENSGFLQKLLPGDLVLADRGFDIEESVAMYRATLAIPAFTRGKQQLSKREVESTRELASVRIHVERVIGTLRQKYTILNGPVEIPFTNNDITCNLTTFDKIVMVSCALNNLCESVVPIC